MPTLSITKTYEDGDTLFEADLDNIIDDIETFLNVTKLDNSNIQDSGIDASTKVQDGTITAAKIAASAVTTAKINDAAVTTAKINDSAVTTAKINDAAVTTAKIQDGAVTYAKLAAPSITNSSSNSGTFSTTSTSRVDVTNLTLSFTTTGRPLMILIQNRYLGSSGGINASGASGFLYVMRDSTDVGGNFIYVSGSTQSRAGTSYLYIDQPSAGTYTYKVQGKVDSGGTLSVSYMSLTVVEL